MHDMEKADCLIGEALVLLKRADDFSEEHIADENFSQLIKAGTHVHIALNGHIAEQRKSLREQAYAKLRQARELLS